MYWALRLAWRLASPRSKQRGSRPQDSFHPGNNAVLALAAVTDSASVAAVVVAIPVAVQDAVAPAIATAAIPASDLRM
jgi:hypothetical protein